MVDFINEEWIPLAVALDISCREFYSMTPKILLRHMPYYAEALRRKRQEFDQNAWHTNIYTLRAISTIGKGRYPQEPLDLYGVRKNVEEVNEEAEKATDADMFGAWALAFNMQNKNKLETKGESEVRDDG